MLRRTPRRLLAAATTLGLLLSLGASAGSVLAGDTRLVDIGSNADCVIDLVNDPNGGPLDLSPVSAGQLVGFHLETKNCGGQNRNNITITVGAQPTAGGNPVWDQLSVPFTDGTTINDVYGQALTPSGAAFPNKACTLNGAKTLLTCSFKSFRAGEGAEMDVALRAPASGSGVKVHTAIKVSENTNDNGSNEDTFEAVADVPFAAGASCDNIFTFYTPSNSNAETCRVAGGNPQSAKITYGDKFTAVQVSEVNGDVQLTQKCGGSALFADVIGNITQDAVGDTVSWTVVVDLKAINLNGLKPSDVDVCHINDENVVQDVDDLDVTKTNKGVMTITFTTSGNGKSRFT